MRLFPGAVYAVSGNDLQGIAARLKGTVPPELVRILGDKVQVIALRETAEAVLAAIDSMRREGLVSGVVEDVRPSVEDSFVALMRE